MSDSLAGFVLAAGAGVRLHPLTHVRPKPLCPVGNVPLVDHAIARVAAVAGAGRTDVAVNAHHGVDQLAAHLGGRVHLSVEPDEPRGTAGALGFAKGWIGGRDVLVTNADGWSTGGLTVLVEGWDHERIRLLVAVDGDHDDGPVALRPDSRVVGALLPWSAVEELADTPAGLYEVSWRPAAEEGRLDVVGTTDTFVDCGTPRDYLAANLLASGGDSVVDPRAEVHGTLVRSVVWDTGSVAEGEHLVDAIRIGARLTVLVR